jgi:hypothetical protein
VINTQNLVDNLPSYIGNESSGACVRIHPQFPAFQKVRDQAKFYVKGLSSFPEKKQKR